MCFRRRKQTTVIGKINTEHIRKTDFLENKSENSLRLKWLIATVIGGGRGEVQFRNSNPT
jgi:hypothetical protein